MSMRGSASWVKTPSSPMASTSRNANAKLCTTQARWSSTARLSNAFLGSGLFDIEHVGAARRPVRVGVATDIGGGTSYSLLQTLAEAYKTARQKGCSFSAFDGFYLATLGNARGLRLDGEIGTLDAGRWADVVVLDPQATPVLAARQELSESLEDMLFALMMLGDDRAVRAVYVKGEKVAGRDRSDGEGLTLGRLQ